MAKAIASIRVDLRNESEAQLKDEWDDLKASTGMNNFDLMAAMIRSYRRQNNHPGLVQFDSDEIALLDKACEVSGLGQDELTKKGLLAECKAQITSYHRILEGGTGNFRGMANHRIHACVQAVMRFNSTAERPDQYFITKGVISKLTGSNYGAITQYFEAHQTEIDEYHEAQNLTEKINRKGKGKSVGEFLKPMIEIELAKAENTPE